MSRGDIDHRRNIFDAFLNLVKREKDDDPVSVGKQQCDDACGGLSPSISSSGSLSNLWIKPDNDLIQEPLTRSLNAQFNERNPNPTTPVSDPLTPCSLCSDPSTTRSLCANSVDTPCTTPSGLPELQISSVSNLPKTNSDQVTAISYSICSLASETSVSASSVSTRNVLLTDNGNLSPLRSSAPTPTECSEVTESPSNTVEESQTRATHFSYSFGCLDDLLPQNDPARSDYIHYKCTRLRYPLPLAVAMSKLYSPSNIPSFSSHLPGTMKDHIGKRLFRKSQQPDQGFLEIDDSHFTLNTTPPTSATSSNNSTKPVPTRPLTKAQLRYARSRPETRNRAAVSDPTNLPPSENPSVLVPVVPAVTSTTPVPTVQVKSTRGRPRRPVLIVRGRLRRPLLMVRSRPRQPVIKPRGRPSRRRKTALRDCRRLLRIEICSDLDETSTCDVSIQSRRHSGSTSSPSLPPEGQSFTSRSNTPTSHVVTELEPIVRPSKRSSSGRSQISTSSDTSTPPRRLIPNQIMDQKPKRMELLAFWLLSSHHFAPTSREQHPHKIYLKIPSDPRFSTLDFLMFGDFVRILCRLANGSNSLLIADLATHCVSTFRIASPSSVYLRSSHGLIALNMLRLYEYLQFAVIPCPSTEMFRDALKTALNINGLDWRTCVSTEQMLKMCLFLSVRNPALKLLPEFPLEKHQLCFLISRYTRNLVTRLQPFVQHIAERTPPTNRHTSNETDKSFPPELINFLSPFWCRVLTTVLPDYQHIIGLGLLTRSFRMVYQHLFLRYSNFPMIPSWLNLGPISTLQNCLAVMHKHVSLCLTCLRDTYPSLVAAGSCISARASLTQIEKTTGVVDPSQYRLELGRARLFDSVEAARTNVVRVLNEEMKPNLCQLIELCQLNIAWGVRLVTENHLLGPYAGDGSCESATRLIEQSLQSLQHQCRLTGLVSENSLSPNSPVAFCSLAVRMHEFLRKKLAPYIISFQTALNKITNNLRRSLNALGNSWIPAFQCSTGDADWRASTDVQTLVTVFQNQFDMLEVWLRSHHNVIAPEIHAQMFALQSLLTKTGLDSTSSGPTTTTSGGLRVPYGSKNKQNCRIHPDQLSVVDPLPKWPPTLSNDRSVVVRTPPIASCDPQTVIPGTSSRPESRTAPQTESTSVLLNPSKNAPINQEPEKSRWVCVPSTSGCVTRLLRTALLNQSMFSSPKVVVSSQTISQSISQPSTAATSNVSSPPATNSTAASAKRVCIYLSDAKNHCTLPTEIITPRAIEPDTNDCSQLSTQPAYSIDRRRLGRLKRRMKMSHANYVKTRLCFNGENKMADIADTSTSPWEVSSENSDEESSRSKQPENVVIKDQSVTSSPRSGEYVTICSSSDEEPTDQVESRGSVSFVPSSQNAERNVAVVQAPIDEVCLTVDKPHGDSSMVLSCIESHGHPMFEKVSIEPSDSLTGSGNIDTFKQTSVPVYSHVIPCSVSSDVPSIAMSHGATETEYSVDRNPSVDPLGVQPIRINDIPANAELSSRTSPNSPCLRSSPEPPSPGPLVVDVPEDDDIPVSSENFNASTSKPLTQMPNPVQLSPMESLAIHVSNTSSTEPTESSAINSPATLIFNVNTQLSSVQSNVVDSSNGLIADSDSNIVRDTLTTSSVIIEPKPTTSNVLEYQMSQCIRSDRRLSLLVKSLSTPLTESTLSLYPTTSETRSITCSSTPFTQTPGTEMSIPLAPSQDCLPVQSENISIPSLVEPNSAPFASAIMSSSAAKPSSRIGLVLERVTAELNELVPWLGKCTSSCNVPGPLTASILGQSVPQTPGLSVSIDLTSDD